MGLFKLMGRVGFIEGAAKHREEDVGSSSGEVEEGLGVVLALADLLVVAGAGGRVAQGGERGGEEGPVELLVPLLDGCSPLIGGPELRVVGARPA